ncbi:MAG: hypothetical protein ACI4XR_02750 [Bacilli bacterium]
MKMPKFLFLSLSIFCFSILNVVNAEVVNDEASLLYAIEQASPDDIDLSSNNGTIYTHEYLHELEEASGSRYVIY